MKKVILISILVLGVLGCKDKASELKKLNQLEIEIANQDSIIERYIETSTICNKLQYTKTPEGIYIATTRKGNGVYPDTKSTVTVHQLGWTIDRSSARKLLYDSYARNKKNTLSLFIVIEGLRIGIKKIDVGGAASFIVPSRLGWGKDSLPNPIKPDQILMFDVELFKIN